MGDPLHRTSQGERSMLGKAENYLFWLFLNYV